MNPTKYFPWVNCEVKQSVCLYEIDGRVVWVEVMCALLPRSHLPAHYGIPYNNQP